MTLPINFSAVVWFVPKGVWEWEDDPTSPPATCDATPSTAAPENTGGCDAAAQDAPGTARRLVFKGISYDTRYSWIYADSPLSRPWQPDDVEEANRRRKAAAPPLPDPPDAKPGPK